MVTRTPDYAREQRLREEGINEIHRIHKCYRHYGVTPEECELRRRRQLQDLAEYEPRTTTGGAGDIVVHVGDCVDGADMSTATGTLSAPVTAATMTVAGSGTAPTLTTTTTTTN